MKINNKIIRLLLALIVFSSCEDFIDVELSSNQIIKDVVFDSDHAATLAVTGIYRDLIATTNFLNGDRRSTIMLAGLSADEFSNYSNDADAKAFEQGSLIAENELVLRQWSSIYKIIYEANAAIEGLLSSKNLTKSNKDQLLGEAYFLRALGYFYLINFYGDVPLILTTDYTVNAKAARTPTSEVYSQIIVDLLEALQSLKEDYITVERVRPNKATAQALLARVYLYMENWTQAEQMATIVIENNRYNLVSDLNSVFLKNSEEAIWQLGSIYNSTNSINTQEARSFIITSRISSFQQVLTNELLSAFEPNDQRLRKWVSSTSISSQTLFYPFKYKVYQTNQPVTEYSTVLRLSEQYLIRAEARAQQGNIIGGSEDLNLIRNRAGLTNTSTTTQQQLLEAILKERQMELFSEGHRWFDLKRTGRDNSVLSSLKSEYTENDKLYPIPQTEIDKNPALTQNPNY